MLQTAKLSLEEINAQFGEPIATVSPVVGVEHEKDLNESGHELRIETVSK